MTIDPPRMRISQQALLAARKVAKSLARTLNADVDYDLRMYEAIRDIRRWSPGDVIFDVGANDGRTVFRLMRHLPAPRIFAFEPASDTFRTMADRTAGFGTVEPLQLALGSRTGRETMYLDRQSVLNSFYADWASTHGRDRNVDPRTETVETTTLDRFAAQRDVDRIHLLKIDTEGHDLEVLKGAAQMLDDARVDVIQVEAGFDVPGRQQPSLEEMQAYLGQHGYYLYGIYNQCRGPVPKSAGPEYAAEEPPTVLVFCDALFVRGRPAVAAVRNGG